MCTSLSLGAGEHALRLAHAFAAERAMYGTVLLRLPAARRVLGRAAACLELADAASLLAARCAHGLPREMSVVSALAKAGVPDIVQGALDDLAELVGARGFLTGAYADGVFQKLERDHRVAGVFDGTTAVNRAALIGQFRALAGYFRGGGHDADGLARTLDGAALPPLDTSALRLISPTGCSVVQALPGAAARLADTPASPRARRPRRGRSPRRRPRPPRPWRRSRPAATPPRPRSPPRGATSCASRAPAPSTCCWPRPTTPGAAYA